MNVTKDAAKFFYEFYLRELGIDYSDLTSHQLQSRINTILKKYNSTNADEIVNKIKIEKNQEVIRFALDVGTNNETLFFRDPKLFQFLEKQFFSDFFQKNKSMDIWSCACSTGQEPYSVSMILYDLSKKIPFINYNIVASDISETALSRAQNGLYTDLEVSRGLTELKMNNFFTQTKYNEWKVKEEIKKPIHFKKINLIDPIADQTKYDLILCRNVLIYQKPNLKNKTVNQLEKRLKPNGVLILGAAENLFGIDHKLTQVNSQGCIYYQNTGGE